MGIGAGDLCIRLDKVGMGCDNATRAGPDLFLAMIRASLAADLLADWITDETLQRLGQRVQRLSEFVDRCIERNGGDSKTVLAL